MMINLQPIPVEGGRLIETTGETTWHYTVMEVRDLTKWEALRLLYCVETFLVFAKRAGQSEEYERTVLWRSWCDVKEGMWKILRECEEGYLRVLRESIGIGGIT